MTRDEAVLVLRPDRTEIGTRTIAAEAPVAIEVNGLGYAVMMMTSADLEVFATGFLLTERLIDGAADLLDIDVAEVPAGHVVRVTVSARVAARIGDRVRHRSSDTSCGLCGISGLEQLRRPVPERSPRPAVGREALFAALGRLRAHQPLGAATGATHAAAACDAAGQVIAAYEDVGRHNALDKLVGWLATRQGGASTSSARTGSEVVDPLPSVRAEPFDVAQDRPVAAPPFSPPDAPAFLLVTSRLSFEMVDKALVARAPLLVGVSAATALAVDHARAHGLTLVALARPDAMLVMNDPHRLFGEPA